MSTTWAEVLTATMGGFVDSESWKEQFSISPARFFRAKSVVLTMAYPMLCRPMALKTYIKKGVVKPVYADFLWISTEESTAAESVVETGLTGFEMCSCTLRTAMPNNEILETPYQVVYDAETGTVTFPAQAAAGLEYELDFYTDGEFPDLTDEQLRLMALAVAEVWYEKFDNNELNMQPKIHDDSFTTVNEANYLDKTSQRQQRKRLAFNDELRAYEQRCAYAGTVKSGTQMTLI